MSDELLANRGTDFVRVLTRDVPVILETEDGTDFEERTITVRRLASRRCADLFMALNELPGALIQLMKEQPEIDPAAWMLHIGAIGAAAMPTLQRVVAVGANLSLEEVGRVTIDSLIELLVAIAEVNRIGVIQQLLSGFLAAVGKQGQ